MFRLVLTDPRINDEPAEQAISTLGTLGFHFEAAQVFEWGVDHQFEGRTLRAGLRLARGYQFQQVGKFLRASFCFTSQLRLSRPQRRPELVLAINLDEFRDNQPPGPGIEVFADPNGFPLVRAVRPGEEVDLTGGLAATFETPLRDLHADPLRFELDDLGVSGWRVMAYRGDVQVMLACGRDARRSSEVEDANQDRLEWVQGLFTYFQTATFSTQQFVLDASPEYRVLADWSWTGEHRLGGGPTPEQPVTQEFRFTTAPAAGPDQQRTILEQDVFDPRACRGTCWPSRPWTTRRPSWTTRCASTSASVTSPSCSTATDATSRWRSGAPTCPPSGWPRAAAPPTCSSRPSSPRS